MICPSPRRVFLVGLMGAGKSTVGEALAQLLACPHLDNDLLLLADAGATAEALSITSGAEALHAQESAQLRRMVTMAPPFVAGIAASAADRPADLALLATSGTVVYLRVSAAVLAARLGHGVGRPWLKGDAQAVLQRMFNQRDAAFRSCADLVMDCDSADAHHIASDIAAALSAH